MCKKNNRCKKSNRGYSFTEVLIAAFVSSLVAAAVISSFSVCRNISFNGKNRASALYLIQQKMEAIRADIKLNRFDNLDTWNGQTTTPVISKGKDTGSSGDDISGVMTVAVAAKDKDENGVALTDTGLIIYAEVSVNLTWNFLGSPYNETLTINTIMTL